MSDIFISYASEDRDQARRFAETLAKHGWSVWWDRRIPFGKSFDEVIEGEIGAARCMIVLWSRHSVESGWVKNEAREGKARQVLVPALIEPVRIPLEFRHLQTADLTEWEPDSPHAQFNQLLEQLQSLLAHRPTGTLPRTEAGSPPREASSRPLPNVRKGAERGQGRSTKRLVAGMIITALLLGGAAFAIYWAMARAQIAVPNLIGKPVGEARNELAAIKLALGHEESVESEAAKPDTVIGQTPAAGERTEIGTKVDLVVAAAIDVQAPDLAKLPMSQARVVLERSGLKVGKVTTAGPFIGREAQVSSQSPSAGTPLSPGSAVDLAVWVPGVRVPSLIKLSLADARKEMERARLKLVVGPEKVLPQSYVVDQSPAAGEVVETGDSVTVTMHVPTSTPKSAGVAVPDLFKVPLANAADLTAKAGLKLVVGEEVSLGNITEPSQSYVIRQSPAAGTVTKAGESVTVTVNVPAFARKGGLEVPALIKLSLADAERLTTEAGLKLVVGEEVTHKEPHASYVIKQSPAAGTVTKPGDSVTVTVSVPYSAKRPP